MKTVVMLRNNDTPDYDMRMALQKKTLEEAGYNVYQFFIRYEQGLKIWCLHGEDTEYWSSDNEIPELYTHFLYYCNLFKPFVVLRNILSVKMLYKAIKHFVKEDIDVVHAHNLDTMPLAIKLKKEYDCKIVYDMREMYAFMAGRELSSTVEGYYLWKDKQMWKYADHVFTMEDVTYEWMPFLREVLSKNRTVPVTTVANSRPLKYARYRDPSKNRPFTLLFLGTISRPRFIKEAVEVVEEFKGKIKFIIGGNVQNDPYYREVVDKCKYYEHSQYIGQLPHSQVVSMTRKCDAVFCMIDPAQRNNARAMANKQHEAMIAGRPIITVQGTHSGDMTIENDCGYVIPLGKRWLRLALHGFLHCPQLSSVFGMNALKAAKDKYNWGIDSTRMLAVYKELVR